MLRAQSYKNKSKSKSKSNSKSTNKSKSRRLLQAVRTLRVSQVKIPTFEENYHLHNKKKIIDALRMSGMHKINKDKAHLFISNQITPLRRRAAKDLIDNTEYITLKETFNIIEKLIIKTYDDIEKHYSYLSKEEREEIKIYMYAGPNNKSFYFFSCIALYCIEKYNNKNKTKLQIPIFVDRINSDFLLNLENNTLIIVDDVSYSGSQLAKMLDSYHNKICIVEGRRPPNIYALLTALNEFSLDRLSKVTLTRSERGGAILTEGPTPFKIYYLKERLYKPLVKIIGIERYFYVNLFFNAWLSEDTNLAMYLDHKVADTTSTYKNVYVYGPIVPATYDINYVYGYVLRNIYSHKYLNQEDNDKLYKDFLKKHPNYMSTIKKNPFDTKLTTIKKYLTNQATEEIIDIEESPYFRQTVSDVISNKENMDTIKFIPFIETCNKSQQLNNIIENKEIQEMDYTFFMADPEVSLPVLEEIIEFTPFTLEHILRLTTMIDNYRCPIHWYKDPSHPLRLT